MMQMTVALKSFRVFFSHSPNGPTPPTRSSEIVRSDWLKSDFVVFFKMAEHVEERVSRKTRFQIDICLYIALLNA